MTADLEFALPLNLQPLGTGVSTNGHGVTPVPMPMRPVTTDATGRWLIAAACVLLAGLAVAMGVTSFHAQFTYIFATKRQWAPAILEALGLDAGAVIFSLLGIALARLGRRAAVERVLVVVCALGSCGMNVLNANLGSPRSVAVYAMPPVLFALTSDRLVAVVRRAALGRAADDAAQHSAWHLAGRSALYCLRFAVDRRNTTAGCRQAILNATPLPQGSALPESSPAPADPVQLILDAIREGELTAKLALVQSAQPAEPSGHQVELQRPRSRRRNRKRTKTARFLGLVQDKYGPLADFRLADVYRASAELAPKVRLHDGSARTALRAAVIAAQDGAQ
jgi:hypothetical protein